MNPYEPGSRVVIRHNPHHRGVENIVGAVVAFRPGAGFMGCDLVDVRYEDLRDGEVHELPFGPANLTPGVPQVLRELAARYEALAVELRRLAGDTGQ